MLRDCAVTRDELEESLSEGSAFCDEVGEVGRRGEKAPGRRYVKEFMLEHTWVARALGVRQRVSIWIPWR